MKSLVKKALATAMAFATLTVGATGINANTKVGCIANAATGGISSPMYAYYTDVSFKVTTDSHKTGSVTVTHSPVKFSYGHCSLGQATIKVTVNHSDGTSNTYYYTDPASSGVSINQTISNCAAGDTVSYEVYPDSSVNCVRAEGQFRLYY